MTDKKTELINRFSKPIDSFISDVREEAIKAGLEITPELVEYLYKKLGPLLEDIADKLAYKAESWLKSRARKFKMWLKRRRIIR